MGMETRDKTIDVMKGIGVCLMVVGHSEAPKFLTQFIYLFHMLLFIMASGYFWKESNTENLRNFILKKIRSLWLPYAGVVSAYSVFHNILYRLYAYTDDVTVLQYNPDFNLIGLWDKTKILKTILFALIFRDNGITQLANPMWFVGCLFQTIILYACVEYVLKKIKLYNNLSQFLVATVFLMVGWYCSVHGLGLLGMARAMSCYSIFHLGRCIGKNDKKLERNVILFRGGVGLIILLILTGRVSIDLASHVYENPIILVIESLAGWYFTYASAYCVTNINRQFISIGLQLISRKAIWILALHALAFKGINWIGTLVYHHPKCMIAGYFTSYSHIGYWWIAYSAAGIVLPLLIACIFEQVLQFFKYAREHNVFTLHLYK